MPGDWHRHQCLYRVPLHFYDKAHYIFVFLYAFTPHTSLLCCVCVFHTLVAIFQIRCCISKNCTVRAMGFALCRVYLRNPLDPPDISGFGRDHLDSNKDKRKCMLFDD